MYHRIRPLAWATALLFTLALAVSAALHPDSFSRTRVTVSRDALRVELTFQGRTIDEVLFLDENVDGRLSSEEIEAAGDVLGAYFVARLRFLVGPEERLLEGRFDGIKPTEASADLSAAYQWFQVTLTYPLDEPIDEFAMEHLLFLDSNPLHSDLSRVGWSAGEMREVLFGGGWQRERFRSSSTGRRGTVVFDFIELGLRHILGGYDHLAFLLALLVAARRFRGLIGIVTAFTVAHSITLALAALDVVHVPTHFVELAIALSIAWVGCENLLRKEARTPWLEAFGFGLLHGLGFAGFLADALTGEPLILTALVGFNLGVELGQLAVVGAIVGVLAIVFRKPRDEAGIVPRRFRVVVSLGVAVVGFYWFLERAGWLP